MEYERLKKMTRKPENNDDAMEALDEFYETECRDKIYETIRNRLEQCAEYEKRIEELEGLKGVCQITCEEFNAAIDTTIKHMKG